jgi:hypothetical protein
MNSFQKKKLAGCLAMGKKGIQNNSWIWNRVDGYVFRRLLLVFFFPGLEKSQRHLKVSE